MPILHRGQEDGQLKIDHVAWRCHVDGPLGTYKVSGHPNPQETYHGEERGEEHEDQAGRRT